MRRIFSMIIAIIILCTCCVSIVLATELQTPGYTTEYIRDYETFVVRLREGAALRTEPFVLYVIETSENAGDVAKVDYFDLVEHTGNPYFGDAFRWEIDSPYTVSKQLISDSNGEKLYECTITLGWKTNAEQEAAVQQKISEVINTLGITKDMSDYTKTKLIYDYVCANVAYGYTIDNGLSSISHTSYAALILGKSVCQGYSVSMYKMLNAVGVDTRIVAGTRNNESHGWNIVNIDGSYYYLDATWDAGRRPDDYQYFLRGLNSESFAPYKMFSVYQNIANTYDMSDVDYVYHECKFGEWIVSLPASCTENGLKIRTCICGKTEERTLLMTGHNWGEWEISEHFIPMRTCTNPGCDEVEYQTMSKNIHKCREEDKIAGRDGCRICISVFDRLAHLIEIWEKHFGQKTQK